MQLVHGGDWAGYRAEFGRDALDFSANVSPLGLPEGVARAITAALPTADRYPDPLCRELRAKLALHEGVTSAELCEHCEEDKATISRALDYLETNGFIVRDSDRVKRYRNPLRLTEKGQEVGKRIAEKIGAVLDTVSRTLTEDERAALYRSLSAISRSLNTIAQSSGKQEA